MLSKIFFGFGIAILSKGFILESFFEVIVGMLLVVLGGFWWEEK